MKKSTLHKAKKRSYTTGSTRRKPAMEDRAATLLKPYQIITDRILAMLEQGTVPWRKPWKGGALPKSLATGRTYRGVNVFMLNCVAHTAGFKSPWWMTFNQVKARGGNVRKGEHGTPVVFWKMFEKPASQEDKVDVSIQTDDVRYIPVLRYYMVFNAAQCDGITLPENEESIPAPVFNSVESCEQIIAKMPRPPVIVHGDSRASYHPKHDVVSMPQATDFHSPEEYYATLFHELVHASGHESRLNRDSLREHAPFGSATYAKEELVAEMGASFLCGRGGIENAVIENSAAYIQGWLGKLRCEPKLVVLAAAAAQKAADFILNEQHQELDREQENTSDSSSATTARMKTQHQR